MILRRTWVGLTFNPFYSGGLAEIACLVPQRVKTYLPKYLVLEFAPGLGQQ